MNLLKDGSSKTEQTNRELDPERGDSGEEGVKEIPRIRVMDHFLKSYLLLEHRYERRSRRRGR